MMRLGELRFIVLMAHVEKAGLQDLFTHTSDGVDLVEEDDASFLCAGHFKEFSHHPSSLGRGETDLGGCL